MQGLSHELQATISRAQFEASIESVVDRLTHCVATALADSQIRPEAITRVFYTGGTSAVPLLRQHFGGLFASAQHVQGDTFGSVGLGLTIDAARRFA